MLGMTRTEDNAWFLIAGLLIGMELEFLFMPDIDFFREKWPIVLVVLIVWAIVRRGSND
jgi:hypothetical protein